MESPVKQVYIRNEKIIYRLQKILPEKIASVQVSNKITLFLGKVRKVLTQIEAVIPSSAVVHEAIDSEGMSPIFSIKTLNYSFVLYQQRKIRCYGASAIVFC